jgi:enoyl-CoA hydratase
MGEAFVTVERLDHVALVRLDRPRANALSVAVLAQLHAAATDLHDDPPGAVVLWGGRRIFAAGADIVELGDPGDDRGGDGRGDGGDDRGDDGDRAGGAGAVGAVGAGAGAVGASFAAALGALASVPRATIAAVNGYALGGGLELALACDFRVCAEDSRFGLPEVLLGVIPGGGGTQRLPRLIGSSRAKELILTGRQVRADEALSIGLVNRVVAADRVLDAALTWAADLAAGPLVAHALAKSAIDRGLETTLAEGLAIEREAFVGAAGTEDAARGIASFRESGPGKATFVGR